MMNPVRKRKLILVMVMMTLISSALGLILYALSQNINLFYTPSQVQKGEAPIQHTFRIGGLVVPHSLKRDADGLTTHFELTDTANAIEITYRGVLPDLFKEGQGIIAEGMLVSKDHFKATQVLAKHDEKYMPPEVSYAVRKAHDS